jgi:DNA (cytosine-5)-methyltransferase 1
VIISPEELIVDNFAGGGGASVGIQMATGRAPDLAINHDPEALALYRANHPSTRTLCEDVFTVVPREVVAGRPVGLLWASPDCTFFSKARGGKPHRDRNRARKRRGLAGVVLKWAAQVKPRMIFVENVEEFRQWGPLGPDGQPCPKRKGQSFRRWQARLLNLGYEVESRELRACDFGAPTSRRRLFIIARCDGQPITWPEATHGPGRAAPYRTAAECIDWSIPCPSIFGRKKPLAVATQRRIARGIVRYVVNAAAPFIVPITHAGGDRVHSAAEPLRTVTCAPRGEFALISPALVQMGHGERQGQAPRALDIGSPLGTVTAGGNHHALVSAFLAKHFGGGPNGKQTPGTAAEQPLGTVTATDHHALVTSSLIKFKGTCLDGQPVTEPLGTVQAQGNHYAETRAFLLKYYGTEQAPQLGLPLDTVTTKDRFAIVTIAGIDYMIVDIGMRMLTPRELFNASGFPRTYKIDPVINGKPLSKTAQVHKCGNAVPPHFSAAVVGAQKAGCLR